MAHISRILPPFPKAPPPPLYPPDRERRLDIVANALAREWVEDLQRRSPAIRRQMVLARLVEDGKVLQMHSMALQYFRTSLCYDWQVSYFVPVVDGIYLTRPSLEVHESTTGLTAYKWVLSWLYVERCKLDQRVQMQRYRARSRRKVQPRPTRYVKTAETKLASMSVKRAIKRMRALSSFRQRLRFNSPPSEEIMAGIHHPLLRRLRTLHRRFFFEQGSFL